MPDVEFIWDINLGEAVVGAGTLLLALFTWRLARQTRSAVKLSRQSIEAQDMPFVIAVTNPNQHWFGEGPSEASYMWWFRLDDVEGVGKVEGLQVRLWNVGRGPAIVRDVRLDLGGVELLSALDAEIAVAPGGPHDLPLRLVADELPGGNQSGVLRIYYAHMSGQEYMTRSMVRIGDKGVRCSNHEQGESDTEGRFGPS